MQAWGGGILYRLLKEHRLEHKIAAWSDNNSLKFYKPYLEENLLVIPPKDLISQVGKHAVILVASSAYDLIKNQLKALGYEHIYLFNFAFMDLSYTDKEFIYEHMSDFERAFARMADEKSKRIFVNILNYRITKEEKYLTKMQKDVDDEKYQYFDSSLFHFDSQESFLDVGAYIGDTFLAMKNFYTEGWKSYYGFEADHAMFLELRKRTESFDEKIKLYNLAAWNQKETLYFDSIAGSSKMGSEDSDGKIAVSAASLDKVLQGEEISFVKMDIEGAEYQALSDMKNLIRKNQPVLAVCVYHLRDDFYKLTDFIESCVPGTYAYYFRQYRYTPTETVCYAVPLKRRKSV